MPQDVHHDTCRHILSQQQRCTRMSKVMESTLRYAGTIEKSMELVSKNCAIDWAAIGPRENQSQVIALVFGKLRLGLLLAAQQSAAEPTQGVALARVNCNLSICMATWLPLLPILRLLRVPMRTSSPRSSEVPAQRTQLRLGMPGWAGNAGTPVTP